MTSIQPAPAGTAQVWAYTHVPRGSCLTAGTLEASNVDVSQAMTDMIEAQRAFSMASKAIQTQDQILEIANQVKK